MTQALLLALAGSFYPVGVLFVLRYLGARRGLFLASLFLIGGALGCALVSVLELALLHALPLDRQDDPGANGAVYIVLGAALLIACIVLARRGRRMPVTTREMTADPSRVRAFLMGLLVYSPGIGLIAAVKALHDAQLPAAGVAVGVVLCIAVVLWMAEVPILATAISPRRSGPVLRRAGQWIAMNGRLISIVIGMVLGAYLVVEGILIITDH